MLGLACNTAQREHLRSSAVQGWPDRQVHMLSATSNSIQEAPEVGLVDRLQQQQMHSSLTYHTAVLAVLPATALGNAHSTLGTTQGQVPAVQSHRRSPHLMARQL